MFINPLELPPGGPAVALASAILLTQSRRIDRVTDEVAAELQRYQHSRQMLDDLIARLIDEAHAIDVADGIYDFEDMEEDDPLEEVGDSEPSLGSSESYVGVVGSGTYWNGLPMSAYSDECEDVCEDEGAQFDDEGFDQDEDRGAHEGV